MSLFDSAALPLNCDGNAILHIAAMRSGPQNIDILVAQNPSLVSARNYHGETPMEALDCRLEVERTTKSWGMKTNCISDQFCGFCENTVKTLIKMRDLTPTHTTPIDEARLKHGCTCGQCLKGFLLSNPDLN